MTEQIEKLSKNIVTLLANFGNDISLLIDKPSQQPTKWLVGGIIHAVQGELNLFSQSIKKEKKAENGEKTSNS